MQKYITLTVNLQSCFPVNVKSNILVYQLLLIKRTSMAFYQLTKKQFIAASKEEVWEFMSSPKNLQRITPPHMGFKITSKQSLDKMYEGMMISYKVAVFPKVKMTWVTEITHIEEFIFFVDEQRIGPYRLWHHEHHIEEVENGVLMTDIVSYCPPFGILGKIANKLFIERMLTKIFKFRFDAVDSIFNKNHLK